MKDTTQVNGVTLTRAQVEAALKDLNAPEPSLLTTTNFPFWASPEGYHICNRLDGKYENKGLFLSFVPSKLQWALVKDQLGYPVLTIQKKETKA